MKQEMPGVSLSFEPSNLVDRTMSQGSETPVEIGVSGVADLPILQRIEAQEYLLEKHFELTQAVKSRPFISDRTPLDMIGYMLGEVTMHNTDPQIAHRIDRYVQRCIDVADKTYAGIIILRPLPHYEGLAKRPPENVAYQRLFQMIVEGARCYTEYSNGMMLDMPSHEDRLREAIEFIQNTMKTIADEKALETLH